MLTDERKTEILLEERYRQEVRATLEPPKSRLHAFLGFVNSPLGIWFMSSVLLAGVTSAWLTVNERRAKTRAEEARVERIKIEMDYRMTTFERALERYGRDENFRLHAALDPLADPVTFTGGTAGTPAFPEFVDRTATSVLIEFRVASTGANKATAIQLESLLRQMLLVDSMEDNQHPLPLPERKEVLSKARALIQDFRKAMFGAAEQSTQLTAPSAAADARR